MMFLKVICFIHLFFTLCIPLTMTSMGMENNTEAIPRAILEYMGQQKCIPHHNHTSIRLTSIQEDKSDKKLFSFQLCGYKATISDYLNQTYNLNEKNSGEEKTFKELSYTFEKPISYDAASLITAYMECYGTKHQKQLEKTLSEIPTLTETFDLFSELISAAQTLQISPLLEYLNNFIFTTLLNDPLDTISEYQNFYEMLLENTLYHNNPLFSFREPSPIHDLIASPDQRFIVTTQLTKDTCFVIITIYACCRPSEPLVVLETKNDHTAIEFSRDGKLLAIKTIDCVALYCCDELERDPKNLKPLSTIYPNDDSKMLTFSFSTNSKKCLITTYRCQGEIYDCTTLSLEKTIDFKTNYIHEKPIFTNDDTHIIVAFDYEYALFSCDTGEKKQFTKLPYPINSLHLSPDGQELIVLAEPLCLFVGTKDLKYKENIKQELYTITKIAFSHDSLYCAVTSDKKCYLFKRGSLKPEQEYICKNYIAHVSFSPTSSHFMLFDSYTCLLHDYNTQKLVKTFPINCLDGTQMIFTPDGRFIIITCDKTGKIYTTYPIQELIKRIKK